MDNKTNHYKVSVIIPFYNAHDYIARCVKNLLEQSMDGIEYIFINDGSSDNSIEILNLVLSHYPQRSSQVVLFDNEQNKGVVYCREIGIKRAQGEYIGFCDADDWPSVDLYKKLYRVAKERSADMVWCDFYRAYGNDSKYVCQKVDENPIEYIKAFLCNKVMGVLWNKLFRREILQNDKVKTPPYGMMEDVCLLVQCLLLSKTIAYLPETLYYYYDNPNSLTNIGNRDKIERQQKQIGIKQKFIYDCLDKYGLQSQLKKEIGCNKYFRKMWTLPLVNTWKGCDEWMRIWPEINVSLFFNPYIPIHQKIVSILIIFKLYPLVRKINSKSTCS